MAYNLPYTYYTYIVKVIGIVNTLRQSNSSQNSLMFVKATNAATKTLITYKTIANLLATHFYLVFIYNTIHKLKKNNFKCLRYFN